MARALCSGILAALVLSSLFSVQVSAASLTVQANPSNTSVLPGTEIQISGSVHFTDKPLEMVPDALVEIIVESTSISVNTTTAPNGLYETSITAPSEPGEYTVNVTATKGSDSGFTTFSLSVEALPEPMPDISVLDGISFWPDTFVTDSKILVNATVRNLGDLDANATVKIFLGTPSDGKLLSSERLTVPAGDSNVSSVMWPALSGAHLFTAVADLVDPSDSNFTNNQANATIEVPDTCPPTISVPLLISPGEPTNLDAVTVLASVEDDLGLAEDGPVMLVFSLNNATEEAVPMTITLDGFLGTVGPFPGGTFVLLKVRAADASNNTVETESYRLDVYHSSIVLTIGNATTKPGKELSLSCTAKYEDGSSVAGQETLLVLDGVDHLSTTDLNGVAEFSIVAPIKPGSYNFTVFIHDKRLPVNSSGELTVVPIYPDIMIIQDGISFSWTNASEVLVTVTLYNRGEAPGEVLLTTFLGIPSGGILLDSSNLTLEPGEFYFHTFFWHPEPGHYAITAHANCSGDSEPWNNLASAQVTIPATDAEAVDAAASGSWNMGLVLRSLGLGILFSAAAIVLFTKFTPWRKGE